MEAKIPQTTSLHRLPSSEPNNRSNDEISKRGTTLASPSINGKPPPIHLDESGPLKKRLKHRYSLDSNYSFPETPSAFYNFTPNCASSKKTDSLGSRSGIRALPFRTPFEDISKDSNLKFRYDRGQTMNKSEPILSLFEKENTTKIGHVPPCRSMKSSVFAPRSSHLQTLGRMPTLSRSHVPTRPKDSSMPLLPYTPISIKAKKIALQSSAQSAFPTGDDFTKSYIRLISQQYEFFELSSEEVAACKAKNVTVEVGQVALRCRHCTCISLSYRPKGSMIVAKTHGGFYKYFYDRKSTHVEELCPFVSKPLRKRLTALRSLRESKPGGMQFGLDFEYWCAKGKAEDVVETTNGLRFESTLLLEEKTGLSSFSYSSKNRMNLQNEKYPNAVYMGSAPCEQNSLLQDQKPKAIERPHASKEVTSVSKKLPLEIDGENYDETFQQEGLKGIMPLTQQRKRAERNWNKRLREFVEFKDRTGHGKVQ